MILTLGEGLVCAVPADPVAIDVASALQLRVGGAELNFVVGVRRLGLPATWVGCVGDDPLGRLILRCLDEEGADRQWVRVDGRRPTGLYLREWLPDGVRRPYYYRRDSAALGLGPAMWPSDAMPDVTWLHLSGITAALGSNPRRALDYAVTWASERGIPVSFDPNYRPWLWSGAGAGKDLARLAAGCQVLLMSEEDAELLFKTRDPARAIERGHALGVETVVLKLGERGAVGSTAGAFHVADAAPVQSVVDPVGAGDGFNAGFVAGMVMSGNLAQSLALGNYVGARAVEQVGEHTYPYVKDLPAALRTTVEGGLNLEAGPSDASALSRPSTFAGDAPPGAGRSEDARHQA